MTNEKFRDILFKSKSDLEVKLLRSKADDVRSGAVIEAVVEVVPIYGESVSHEMILIPAEKAETGDTLTVSELRHELFSPDDDIEVKLLRSKGDDFQSGLTIDGICEVVLRNGEEVKAEVVIIPADETDKSFVNDEKISARAATQGGKEDEAINSNIL